MNLKNSFPKTIRLNHSLIIRGVFEKGRYKSLGPVGVKFSRSEAESSRFLFSINKNVGNSPCRNHIKRLLREAVRIERSKLNCSFEICFFVANSSNKKMGFYFVHDLVRHFFNQLNEEFCR